MSILHITQGEFAHSTPVPNYNTAEHATIVTGADIAVFDDGENDFILRPKTSNAHADVFRFEVISDDDTFRQVFYAFDTTHATQIADTLTAHHRINNWTLYDEEREHVMEVA